MKHSTQGKEYIVGLFGFDWINGSSEYNYDVADQYGKCTRLKAEQIYFLQTAVARGEFIPMSQVHPVVVEKHGCDKCGILAHCTRTSIDDRGGEAKICNHCLQYVEDPELRDKGGGLKECSGCSALGCEYHPSREQRRLA